MSIRVSQFGQVGPDGTMEITFSGIPKDNSDHMQGVTMGQYWMGVIGGQLTFIPARQALPEPTEDESMLPFWRPVSIGGGVQLEMKEIVFEKEARHDSPSFMVKHLCAFHYTPDNYKKYADRLTSYGFDCMRSRRGHDGIFWETWYLPGTWAAKGDLRIAIDQHVKRANVTDYLLRAHEETKALIEYVRYHVVFGSLDICHQRFAMGLDD